MKRRAFSLAELLIAMAFFSVLLVMALGILHWALRGSQAQDSNTRAAFLAQSKMEELFAADKPANASGFFAGAQRDFAWKTDVQPLEGDFLALTVTVSGPRGCSFILKSQRRLAHRELLYSSDGQLIRSSEDYREHEVLPGGAPGSYSLAADGVTLAYVASFEGRSQIFTRRLDRKEEGKLLFAHPSGAQEPVWSQDGKKIAFTAQENGYSQVFSYELKTGLFENQSHSQHHDGSPAWTADGKGILLCRDSSSIILLRDGRETALVDDAPGCWNTAPCLSSDGKDLIFMSNRDGNPEILLKSSGKLTRLTQDPAYDTNPRFSADSKRILFISDRDGGIQRLYTMNPDGSQVQLLSPKDTVSQGVWLP